LVLSVVVLAAVISVVIFPLGYQKWLHWCSTRCFKKWSTKHPETCLSLPEQPEDIEKWTVALHSKAALR
jgi:hypothetical protein